MKKQIRIYSAICLISVIAIAAIGCPGTNQTVEPMTTQITEPVTTEPIAPVEEIVPVEEVWTAHHDGEISGFDYGKAIAVDHEGNVYIVGDSAATGFSTPMGIDIVSIKYDSNGNLVWLNRYSGFTSIDNAQGVKMEKNAEDRAFNIAVDNSGNVYVVGGSFNGVGWDEVLIKYDNFGHKIWEVTYNKGGGNSESRVQMMLDISGNVIISSTKSNDFATVKCNANGKIIWSAIYNGWAKQLDIGYDMTIDDRGNIYVVGESAGTDTNRDYATVKYDSAGDEQWVSVYDKEFSSDIACVVAVDKKRNVYVSGTTGWNTGWATIKYDHSGEQLWLATFEDQGKHMFPVGISVDAYGNAYVTGWVGGGGINTDIITIKYDTNGKMVWKKVFDEGGDEYAYDIAMDTLGNLYITGSSSPEVGQAGNRFMTIKYDSDGNQQWVIYSFESLKGESSSHAIVLDDINNVYVTGTDYGNENYANFATAKYEQVTE